MARSRGKASRLVPRHGGVRSVAGRNRSRVAIVLLALFAAAVQLILAGHVPMGDRHAAAPLLSGDHRAAARTADAPSAHRHAEHGLKPASQEKPGHGQSGQICNLCAVCSGTAPPLPPTDDQPAAPCPQPAAVDDARRDGTQAARHFLTALRPRAPPPMA
ncbi:hypothetical protein JL101_012965 [Skermanella rosea]|uniref:hypothetical protein n=1 Tax=Skermanella rosea TaxID=1817965 RepID=UPI0019344578|nr:hypothetical protein [Skermanella rosea]UEM06300.1 hypothetical protein JL101_012965 [Skermanella rosea]